jgi:hypothetical protein
MLTTDTLSQVVFESCAREVAGILVDEGIEFGVRPQANGMSQFVVPYTEGKVLDQAIEAAETMNEERD